MVIIHEPMSTGTHILLNPSVRSPSSPQQRLTKPFFCDPISTEDRWSVQHGTSVPHHSFVLGTAPLANEPKLVNSENTVSMYKNLYQEQVEKIQSLEKELEVLRGEKKDLQATLEKLNDLLQQKEHRAVVHPFHKFRTALDDYSDIAETRTEIVESDEEDEDLEDPYVIETVPDNYLPPRKRRRGSKSVEHFYGEDYSSEDNSERRKKPNKVKAVKRVVSRHSSLMASSDDEAINNTSEPMPELPENTGVLDLSRIVTWHNELFALSKAFPYKHRLQVMTKRYEAEKQKPAYILLEADDLRLLKKHYENVGQKSRQVALYTKDFMQYFVENEDYVAGH